MIVRRQPQRDPLAAGLLAVIPGAGHFYCGAYLRGMTYMAGTAAGIFLFIIPGIFLWAASILDAVLCARHRNLQALPLVHAGLVNITDGPDPACSPWPKAAVAERPPAPSPESLR